jgi:hypothetical protein
MSWLLNSSEKRQDCVLVKEGRFRFSSFAVFRRVFGETLNTL